MYRLKLSYDRPSVHTALLEPRHPGLDAISERALANEGLAGLGTTSLGTAGGLLAGGALGAGIGAHEALRDVGGRTRMQKILRRVKSKLPRQPSQLSQTASSLLRRVPLSTAVGGIGGAGLGALTAGGLTAHRMTSRAKEELENTARRRQGGVHAVKAVKMARVPRQR